MKLIDKFKKVVIIREDPQHGQTQQENVPISEQEYVEEVCFERENNMKLPQMVFVDSEKPELHVYTFWDEDMNQIFEQVMYTFDQGKIIVGDQTYTLSTLENKPEINHIHHRVFKMEIS